MCGICGIYRLDSHPVNTEDIALMMNALQHRGPDDSGHYVSENLGLGHRRLSIIDLSENGRQPFFSRDNNYAVVFNGEIYNYPELKLELQHEFQFHTETDTEVLLYAYIKWKEDCLHHFNGMFAFVVVDLRDKSIFAARDRFGIKPFYYFIDNERFIFASEIKAILTQNTGRKVNEQVLYDFLVFNRVQHQDGTFFQGIKKLQHGHSLTLADGVISIKRWYNLSNHIGKPFESSDEFRESLSNSVKLRLRSDVPVGAMLSGGLDSSSIVSLIIRDSALTDLNTFSVTYSKGMREDESGFISEYQGIVKNMFYVNPTAKGLYSDLESFVGCLEEPFPGLSVYAEFKLMEIVKDHVTVILNGQGADEYLGGYHYFFGNLFHSLLQQMKMLSLLKELTAYSVRHRSLYSMKAMLYFALSPVMRQKITSRTKFYLHPDFCEAHKQSQSFDQLYRGENLQAAFINHFEYKFEHLLLWGDKTSMHHSLELRFPFLDHHLVENSLSLPENRVIRNGQTKHILREAMKGILPEKIRTRTDKIGFEVPYYKWFENGVMNKLANEVLTDPSFYYKDLLNKKGIEKLLSKPAVHAQEIWKLLNLEIWHRKLVEEN